ncbi:SDR family NAD(P)-dependent oxidoreductase [Spartinivicinus poritis]|uniref:SDR family NAD(P)-dependent oxidoreductase n=1 Tax=Spartinivicinus poritis TaxID=2994640 RepID=A0ABT5UHA7_9GAMM|nr:SDR family NAD(P)-dependent oxidoreductase [Spartinivicinus sp. A2-2]MDE1465783.1 SDR family NAD(P)-dependent oxidoreductase [Spartinivicinus sp. A2-2]
MSILIIGGNSGIGQRLIQYYCKQSTMVLAVSRSEISFSHPSLSTFKADLAKQPEVVCDWLNSKVNKTNAKPSIVISCIGLLHTPETLPEKCLQAVNQDFFQLNMQVNCFMNILLAQCLAKLYGRRDSFKVIMLSAKVGSIADNQLGGWYSYRISKAALNMLVKTLSIEWHRTHPNGCIVAVHPGTTDTELSKPFQANLAANQLYSPQLTAQRIANIAEQLTVEKSGQLLFWDGSVLPY